MTDVKQLITEHVDIWLTAETEKKSGRGRSSGNSDVIYGVQKLRELILELAVTGKLVNQNENEISANDLLKRMKDEQALLIKNKIIRRPKDLSILDSINSKAGWITCYLLDVGDWGAGATPPRGRSDLYGGDIPWFKSGELNADYIYESEERITPLALKTCSLRLNKPNDVLIAMYGATIGKVAITAVECTTNQAVCACTPFGGFSSKYLFTFLKAKKTYFIGMGAGGAQPNISREKLIETVIEVPPLEEQHRIVEKVDELMQLCDQLEQQQTLSNDAHATLVNTLLQALTQSADADEFQTHWQRIVENFDVLFTTDYSIEQLKQTILQLAVMGKLVKQDPNDEPASDVIDICQQAKQQMIKDKLIRRAKTAKSITAEDMLFPIPDSWEWIRMHQITYKVTDGAHHTPKYISKGIPFLSVKDMSGGYLDFSDTRFISEIEHEELFKRCNPQKGDLLITKVGTTGIPIVVDTDKPFSLFVSVALIKGFWEYVNVDFLCLQVASPFVVMQSKEGTEGIGNKNLVLKKIENFLLVLPPLKEQERIVQKINQLFSIIEQLQTLQHKLQKTKLHLADALVASV